MKLNSIRTLEAVCSELSDLSNLNAASWPPNEPPGDGLPADIGVSEESLDDDFGFDTAELEPLISELISHTPQPDCSFEEALHFRELLLQAARAVSLRSRFLARLRAYALTDDLTGLYNRRGLLLLGLQRLKLARRTGEPLLLFFADIDRFKQINDSLGHLEGDAFLICCADVLKRTFRDSDLVARLGGDEFAVLAQDRNGEGGAGTILSRLSSALDTLNHKAASPNRLSLSVGVARFDPHNPVSFGELIALADRQMYEHKLSSYRSGSCVGDGSHTDPNTILI